MNQPRSTIRLQERISGGSEYNVYMAWIEGQKKVVKFPSWFGRIWQDFSPSSLRGTLSNLDNAGIKHIQEEIRENILLILPDGEEIYADVVKISPFVEDLEDKTITLEKLLTDKDLQPDLLRYFFNLTIRTHLMAENHKEVVDPFGHRILKEMPAALLKATPFLVTNLLAKLPFSEDQKTALKAKFYSQVTMNNLYIDSDGDPSVFDTGTVKISDKPGLSIAKIYCNALASYTMKGLAQLTKELNQILPAESQITEEELEQINQLLQESSFVMKLLTRFTGFSMMMVGNWYNQLSSPGK